VRSSVRGPEALSVLSIVTVVLVLAAAAPAAQAAQRFASPGGVTTGSCPQAAPCRIDRAVNLAVSGDEVIVSPGDYDVTSTPLETLATLTVRGVGTASRPRLTSSSASSSTLSLGTGSAVSDIEATHLGTSGKFALAMNPGALIDRVVARSSGTAAIVTSAAQIRDTSAFATGLYGAAVYLYGPGSSTIRNVTAIGTGPNSYGIALRANFGGEAASGNVRNTIARGTAEDVLLTANEPTSLVQMDIDYSNFRAGKAGVSGNGKSTYLPGAMHNQDANVTPPALVDLTGSDIHQLAGSPTIDAGVPGPLNGSQDIDGEARVQDAAIDIGADEYASSATSAPQLTRLRQTNRVFAVGRRSTPRGGHASKRRRRGTKFSFTLDQEAAVTVRFQRLLPGRRVGRFCRPLGGRRAKRRCTRARKRGVLFRDGREGSNSIAFSGRLRGKALPPGRYRAVFTAIGDFGTSTPRSLRFRIVGR
jgi:hypothetical protein